MLFIEQNVELALSVAHRGYVLESGRLLLGGAADDAAGLRARSAGSSWGSERAARRGAIAPPAGAVLP